MIRIIVSFLLTVISPIWLYAAPSVTGVSGIVSSGQSITISGSSFGAKSPAAPLYWYNFDDGTNGTALSGKEGWRNHAENGAKYSNTSPHGGSGLCVQNYVQYGGTTGFDTSYYTLATGQDQLYVSYLFRHAGTTYTTGIDKNWRIGTDDTPGSSGGDYRSAGLLAVSDGYIFYNINGVSQFPDDRDIESEPLYGSDQWTRYEGYVQYSSPAGTSNGIAWFRIGDGTGTLRSYTNLNNRPNGTTYKADKFLLGLMHDHDNLGAGEYHYMYADDVYIDSTLARVEICDQNTKAGSSHCEIQIPSAWSASSATVTVNRGSFGASDSAYLYVVDSTGAANSDGMAITFGTTYGASPSSGVTFSGVSKQ